MGMSEKQENLQKKFNFLEYDYFIFLLNGFPLRGSEILFFELLRYIKAQSLVPNIKRKSKLNKVKSQKFK